MNKTTEIRYPSSVHLFQFCRKVLDHKFGGVRVIDQDVGQILGFDPADCSHWKKGKKNIRSIQAIKAIADHLNVDERLIVDIATGELDDTEGFIEYYGYGAFRLDSKTCEAIKKDFYRKHSATWSREMETDLKLLFSANEPAIDKIVSKIHEKIQFKEAPLYLPEVLANYPSIKLTPVDADDALFAQPIPVQFDLSEDNLQIRFPAGTDSKAYMRYQIARVMAEYFLRNEEFSSLTDLTDHAGEIRSVQCNLFAAKLLTPASLVRQEMAQVNVAKDVIAQLAEAFWVSKSFMNRRLKEILQTSSVI